MVVVGLEMVDIDHQHGDRVLPARGAPRLLGQPLVEGAPVRRAGQPVRGRELGMPALLRQPSFELPGEQAGRRQRGEVEQDAEYADRPGPGLPAGIDVPVAAPTATNSG